MPTFDEDVTVNGRITINKRGDGAVLLDLASERNWEFRQSRSGSSTALELASVGGGGNKSLIINNPGGRVDVAENIRAGGSGRNGRLTLLNSNSQPIIDLQAEFGQMDLGGSSQRGRLVLRDAAGNLVIELSGASGDLSLGGFGKDSDIFIKNGAGTTTIQLSAARGDIILENADCAEEFDCATDDVEPGDVLVLVDGGAVCRSTDAFDKRVVGIASGAGAYQPGIVLDRRNVETRRMPVAIAGKAFCKVNAATRPVRLGDLLTTSSTPGHAMKADDPVRAFGAVIGKALAPLEQGIGLVPVLVGLQ
jgi:hypothetical protein